MPASAATGHQRRDGRRPVGNSRMATVLNNVKAGTQAHSATHESSAASGAPPEPVQ